MVLVGLDQAVQDPGEVADVAGGQGLDEVAADPVGEPAPGLLEPSAPVRGERDVEPAAVGRFQGNPPCAGRRLSRGVGRPDWPDSLVVR